VARAHGVDFPADYAEQPLALADDVAYDMTSSMYHDPVRGNPLDVRWLSGGVVEVGKAAGVPTPPQSRDCRQSCPARRRQSPANVRIARWMHLSLARIRC
jgi:hypothetical protein